MKSISLVLNNESNVIGLAPVLQKSLDAFCDVLPLSDVWVQNKFTDVTQQLYPLLNDQLEFQGLAGQAFVNRIGLYVLWRSIVQRYIGPALGISTEFQNLCKRCPPLGITISNNGKVIPFISRYTCKHFLCPSCRMRKVLATWNTLKKNLVFEPRAELDLVYFEVSRTFSFNGISSCDLKLDVIQDLLKKFKQLLWTCGGAWSIGLATKAEDVTIVGKCAAVCPPLPKQKQNDLKAFTEGANYISALAGQDMYTTVDVTRVNYSFTQLEKLFAKTLNTAVWPASFMLDYANPVAALFAPHLEIAFRNQKTIGHFGPCNTMRKRLR